VHDYHLMLRYNIVHMVQIYGSFLAVFGALILVYIDLAHRPNVPSQKLKFCHLQIFWSELLVEYPQCIEMTFAIESADESNTYT
jgi:hypothetical protein